TCLRDLKFSPEQISALLPDQRKQSKPDTVKNKVQKIMESTDPIGEVSTIIFLESTYTTPENVIAIDSELKRIRHGLREKGASEKVIDALQDIDGITRESNRKQSENRKLRARIGISPSEHFTLRHSPDGPHSSAENYAIINDRQKILPSEPKDKVDRIPYNDLIEELD
ncbi:4297_t:CDS:2, partial [Entrophospora sp. SA101]